MIQVSHPSQKIPKLRFREFHGEWETKELGDITLRMQSGISRSLSNYDIGYPILRSNNIQNGKVNVNDIKYWHFIDDQGADLTKYILEQGDILVNFINSIAQIGKSAIFKNLLGRDIIYTTNILRVSIKDADTSFVFYNFNTEQYNEYIQSITKPAVNQASFTTKEFKKYPIICPLLPEQQKIASFLSSVDIRIEQLQEKKSLLEEYKKGVIRKIFAREIRFKDENGEEYPEWEEKRLDEVGKTYNGLIGKKGENFGKGKKYITYKQIFDKSEINLDRCELVDIQDGEKQNEVKIGDVFFTVSSETPHEIGFSSVLLESISGVYLNSFCFGFRPNSFEELMPEFAKFLFRSEGFRRIIIFLAQGSTRYNLSKVAFLELTITLPCYKEQQKIASFLSNIDMKIQSTTEQIQEAEKWKKGLLQGVFV